MNISDLRSKNNQELGTELEGLMQSSRDYDELLEAWTGWRTIAPPMRDKYERFVELSNEGANEFGHDDLLVLAHPVDAIEALLLGRGVPGGVQQEHPACGRQVKPHAA